MTANAFAHILENKRIPLLLFMKQKRRTSEGSPEGASLQMRRGTSYSAVQCAGLHSQGRTNAIQPAMMMANGNAM